MYIDKLLEFSDSQAVTATADSSVIDLGPGGDAIGEELTIHVICTKDYSGAGTLTIGLKTGDTSSPAELVLSSGAIPAASLKAGREVFCVRVPQGLKRYAKLAYTVASTLTGGAISAFVSREL